MQPWDGGWSFSNFFNQRKYIVEIPCSTNSSSALLNNLLITQPEFEVENEKLSLQKIHPNPAIDFIFATIQSPIEQEVDIQFFDARGTLVKVERLSLVTGSTTTEISIADLVGGFYTIHIPQIKQKNTTTRFVKVRD